jgi:phenylpropionate dioxygenase-like ring-hydroxylating dioxygenase large terminal subunit
MERAGNVTMMYGSAPSAETVLFPHLADDERSEPNGWRVAMRAVDLVARHVAFVQIDGVELALWRDDEGRLSAWENRCPHRGVRLTLGTNTGDALVCRYHGWRFATQTARCVAIPAHPAQTPPIAARVAQYACSERDGFAWVHAGTPEEYPRVPGLDGRTFTTVRSVVVDAPAERVRGAIRAASRARERRGRTLLVVVVAIDEATSIMHGGIVGTIASEREHHALLRAANDRLKVIRRQAEDG